MTGPEHYREAERLVDIAATTVPDDDPAQAAIVARAQVYATLALVAATAMAAYGPDGMPMPDWNAWATASGVPA